MFQFQVESQQITYQVQPDTIFYIVRKNDEYFIKASPLHIENFLDNSPEQYWLVDTTSLLNAVRQNAKIRSRIFPNNMLTQGSFLLEEIEPYFAHIEGLATKISSTKPRSPISIETAFDDSEEIGSASMRQIMTRFEEEFVLKSVLFNDATASEMAPKISSLVKSSEQTFIIDKAQDNRPRVPLYEFLSIITKREEDERSVQNASLSGPG